MSETTVLYLSILIAVLSLLVLGGAIWFGLLIFGRRFMDWPYPYVEMLNDKLIQGNPSLQSQAIRSLVDSSGDFRERRNEFWTAYGQVVLSVFLIAVLAILLLTGTISAEAGLPILSGITGFAIAKSASARVGQSPPGPPGPQA